MRIIILATWLFSVTQGLAQDENVISLRFKGNNLQKLTQVRSVLQAMEYAPSAEGNEIVTTTYKAINSNERDLSISVHISVRNQNLAIRGFYKEKASGRELVIDRNGVDGDIGKVAWEELLKVSVLLMLAEANN